MFNTDDKDRVIELVNVGRRAISSSGGKEAFSKHLRNKIAMLHINLPQSTNGNIEHSRVESDLHDFIITGWIEELLKFLAIKTITGDATMPFQIIPSRPIDEAWKLLLIMPTCYSNVCKSMGNESLIDHDPFDNETFDNDIAHRKKRFNNTLRAYQEYVDMQAPLLYWPEPGVASGPINVIPQPIDARVLEYATAVVIATKTCVETAKTCAATVAAHAPSPPSIDTDHAKAQISKSYHALTKMALEATSAPLSSALTS